MKKFNEGKAHKATKSPYKTKPWDEDKKEAFRVKVDEHIKSFDCYTKQVGNDLEIKFDKKHIAQVMFRDTYVGVKKVGDKFAKEFKYNQLGDIRKELTKIIKECKKESVDEGVIIMTFENFINKK